MMNKKMVKKMKKGKFSKNTKNLFDKFFFHRLLVLFLVVSAITFIISINFFPGKINFKEGEVANKDIVAHQTIEYVDQKATEKLKDEAARSIKEVYNLNLASIENVEKDIANFFTDLKEIRAQYGFSENNTTFDVRDSQISDIFNEDDPINEIRNLNEKYSLYLEESTIINLLEIDHESLKEIEKSIFLSIRSSILFS